MYCDTSKAVEFPKKIIFKQHDLIMAKEQSVLTRIMKIFPVKKILLQHSVLGYRIDLYFSEHKLAVEIDENGHKDRDVYKETGRQKATKKGLDCDFVRINYDKKDFDVYFETGKMHNNINK